MKTIVDEATQKGAGQRRTKKAFRHAPIVLEAKKRSLAISFREIWPYRELLYFLMWRDVKVRYKQTMLGAAWVVMQPIVMTIVFTIFLGKFARIPSSGTPYSLMVFSGLIPWMFFSSSLVGGANSLSGSAHLITKVYFPRLILPLAAIGGRLVDFAISLMVLAAMMYYHRVIPTWKIAALPLLILILVGLALALGTLTSAWNVKYRDVTIVLPVLVQVWMFASPIVYPIEVVPERWQQLYALNPMVGIVGGFRSALLNREFNWMALGISVAMTAVLIVYALYEFKRLERNFADVV